MRYVILLRDGLTHSYCSKHAEKMTSQELISSRTEGKS